jgi:hypothetical protein
MTPAYPYTNPNKDPDWKYNKDPNNEPRGKTSPEPNQDNPSKCSEAGHIGLAFSGGGYRAAAYSLGTMALLQDLKLLGKTRVLSGVSGGSLAVGAYLCGKAGSGAKSEQEFDFYRSVYTPLMQEMDSEDFAAAFVSLPRLLQGQKLILRAADATQALMSRLLGEPASFGSERLTTMLSNSDLSPDYAFFNTTNISSLDLFRFGIQKGRVATGDGQGDADSTSDGDTKGGRRGVAKPAEPAIASTAYILNRYLLRPDARGVGADLRDHARLLRIGDCIASSYAFPGGFDPLIFPYDFFRPEERNPGQDGASAKEAFSDSLICDQKPYIAFLDGGLYDNLGLASVEDIRAFLARKAQENDRIKPIRYVIATDVDNINPANSAYREPSLERSLASHAQSKSPAQWQSPTQSPWEAQAGSRSSRSLIHNPAAAEPPSPSLRRPARLALRKISLPLALLLGALLGVGAAFLLTWVLGQGAAFLLGGLLGQAGATLELGLASQVLQRAAVALGIGFVVALGIGMGLVGLLLWLGWRRLGLRRLGRSGWLSGGISGRINAIKRWWAALKQGAGLQPRQSSQPAPSWTMQLGLSKSFQSGSIDLDPFAVLRQFLGQLVRSVDPAPQVGALKTALIERRLGQLGPAFSGYLKRTRSLTYGFLEQSYAQKRQQAANQNPAKPGHPEHCLSPEHCHLIRNMIFELIPGPDLDPDRAANLITLPVKDFELHRQAEPLPPIMRKLRHAELVVELIEAIEATKTNKAISTNKAIDWPPGDLGGQHPAPIAGQRLELARQLIWNDPDFDRISNDLNGKQVASIWRWLTSKLVFEPGHVTPQTACEAPSAEPISNLVDTVLQGLEGAKRGSHGNGDGNGDGDRHDTDTGLERELRERCTVKLGDTADSYSWIPLICEMATNLSTTLWARGFRWYAMNKLEDQQIIEPGGWYSYRPTPAELRGRALLDLGKNSHAALRITALAGYLSMAFNLLEFLYATIGTSEQAADRLANKLAAILSETTQAKPSGKNEPNQQDDLFRQLIQLPFHLRQQTFQRLRAPEFSLKPLQLALLEPWLNSREGSPETWRERRDQA